MRTIISSMIVSAMALTVIISCKKQENQCGVKPVTQESIQGNWKYIQPPTSGALAYDDYYFTFYGDSFKMRNNHFVDYIDFGTPCSTGSWVDYAKGIYNVEANSISFNGHYTDSLFVNIDVVDSSTECYHKMVGAYGYSLSTEFCQDSLVMSNTSSTGFVSLRIPLIRE